MLPRPTTDADLEYWPGGRPVTYSGKHVGAEDCPAIVTMTRGLESGGPVVRVPWAIDAEELAALASGGTLWLSTWGGLPPHLLEVQFPDGDPPEKEPKLGLATTRELLEEIKTRGEMAAYGYPEERDMAMGAANLLDQLPGSVLDYRTVDSHE